MMSMEEKMIKITNLSKNFGTKSVLNNLSLEIKEGSILGLVGINGAGKSTFLRLLSGVYKADNGTIMYNDEEVYENEKVKKQIFFLADDPYYTVNTKGIDLFHLYETFYDADEEVFMKYMDLFRLNPHKAINNFSKGMRRQLFIALAISVKPRYLLLDEAFDGLDPLARLAFKRAIIDLNAESKCTVIISSHSLRELEDICDTFGILDKGYIISSGEINEEIEKIHKYQIAFNKEMEENDFSDLDLLSFTKSGRIVKIVVKGESEEIMKKLTDMKPLLIDEIEITFEEFFIYEVESRGYLR